MRDDRQPMSGKTETPRRVDPGGARAASSEGRVRLQVRMLRAVGALDDPSPALENPVDIPG